MHHIVNRINTSLAVLTLGMLFLFLHTSFSQGNVEMIGDIKLTALDTVSNSESVLYRNTDGTIGSLPTTVATGSVTPIPLPFQPGWENYGSGFQDCNYHLHAKRVHLSGLSRKGTGPIMDGDTIAILPIGYRPTRRTIGFGKQGASAVRVNIEPDGAIWVVAGTTGQTWIDLTGISYHKTIAIGEYHQGGIVFYLADPPADLNGDGILDHGMIAAASDLSPSPWGCPGTWIQSMQGIGNGYSSAQNILQSCAEPGIAARMCDEATINGFDNWFLPNVEEFRELNNTIGLKASGSYYNLADFDINFYFCAAQSTVDNALTVLTSTGIAFARPRQQLHRVRPIRVF